MALIYCVKNDHERLFKLLSYLCNKDYQDSLGNTALHYAVSRNTKFIKYLLTADFTLRNRAGKCPIHLCDNSQILLWVGQYSNPHLIDSDGNTILHIAVMKNDKAMLKIGFTLGVDRNIKNKDGYTFFELAFSYNFKDLLSICMNY